MAEGAPPEEPGGSSPEPSEEVKQALKSVVQSSRAGRGEAAELQSLGPERAAAVEDQLQETELKRTYARSLLRLMFGQLIVANGVFIAYAWVGKDWNLETSVINVWLAATVVQVVGVVLVVTRSLFPRRDA